MSSLMQLDRSCSNGEKKTQKRLRVRKCRRAGKRLSTRKVAYHGYVS